jgi:hypothetical protein
MQIAQMQADAQLMMQRAEQFLMEDPDGQAQQMADAMMRMQNEQFAEQEANLDAQVDDDNKPKIFSGAE